MTSLARYLLHILFGDWSNSRLGKAMSLIMPTLVQLMQPSSYSAPPSPTHSRHPSIRPHQRHLGLNHAAHDHPDDDRPTLTLDAFAADVDRLFGTPLLPDRMLAMSARLQAEYREKLQRSAISMLPSFQHTLPTGHEAGHYLALDVGGSTFRLALIRLRGEKKEEEEQEGSDNDNDDDDAISEGDKMEARKIKSFVIDERIRGLKGRRFFDWMAERIEEMLAESGVSHGTSPDAALLRMGLAWSFPVEQTSPRTGRLLAMGKGFHADRGLENQDLGDLVVTACRARGLNVEMWAIVNDGAATLLSKAYHDPSTRMSLILGTGMNAAVYLPLSALGSDKFGVRPADWYAAAQRVVVNTELSMFGKHVLPTTKWDDELNRQHLRTDFQPLEYLVTGRYLGEIVRLVLLDAIATAHLFAGHTPQGLSDPYTFETRLVALFESDSDTPTSLATATKAFLQAHPLPPSCPRGPTTQEMAFLRSLARLVSRRAAIYLALALHALWAVRADAEGLGPRDPAARVTVACDGSMIEKYPGFRANCQGILDRLCEFSAAAASSTVNGNVNGSESEATTTATATGTGTVMLEMMPESSIFGAAIAACCNAGL